MSEVNYQLDVKTRIKRRTPDFGMSKVEAQVESPLAIVDLLRSVLVTQDERIKDLADSFIVSMKDTFTSMAGKLELQQQQIDNLQLRKTNLRRKSLRRKSSSKALPPGVIWSNGNCYENSICVSSDNDDETQPVTNLLLNQNPDICFLYDELDTKLFRSDLSAKLWEIVDGVCDSVHIRGFPMETVVGYVGLLPVCKSSILTLKGNAWIGGYVLDNYFNIIQQKHPQQNCFIFELGAGWGMIRGKVEGKTDKKRFNHFDNKIIDENSDHIYLFPFHSNGNHWIFLKACLKSRKIFVFDSNSSGGSTKVLVRKVSVFMKELFIYRCLTSTQWKIVTARCPQQLNGYDCGAFMAAALESTFLNQELTHNAGDMPYIRFFIFFIHCIF